MKWIVNLVNDGVIIATSVQSTQHKAEARAFELVQLHGSDEWCVDVETRTVIVDLTQRAADALAWFEASE